MDIQREELYQALKLKKIPLLTLDNKWHQIYDFMEKTDEIEALEKELNGYIASQGEFYSNIKELKKLKANLMTEIVQNMDATAEQNQSKKELKKLEMNQKYIFEINQKILDAEDRLKELPLLIEDTNIKLIVTCMDYFFSKLHDNEVIINEINEWIKQVRAELKKNIIIKQETEELNQHLYGYIHNLIGADVVDVFDAHYRDKEK